MTAKATAAVLLIALGTAAGVAVSSSQWLEEENERLWSLLESALSGGRRDR